MLLLYLVKAEWILHPALYGPCGKSQIRNHGEIIAENPMSMRASFKMQRNWLRTSGNNPLTWDTADRRM